MLLALYVRNLKWTSSHGCSVAMMFMRAFYFFCGSFISCFIAGKNCCGNSNCSKQACSHNQEMFFHGLIFTFKLLHLNENATIFQVPSRRPSLFD